MMALTLVVLAALDGGVSASADASTKTASALSAEDLEVVKNLELLENLDAASELELLQELSVER